MARKDDDKKDISRERLTESERKIEARFTKQARATIGQSGQPDWRKIDDTHATDGGDHLF